MRRWLIVGLIVLMVAEAGWAGQTARGGAEDFDRLLRESARRSGTVRRSADLSQPLPEGVAPQGEADRRALLRTLLSLSPEEIRRLREEALRRKKALKAPIRKHPGRVRTVVWRGKPIPLLLAVGYVTIVELPRPLRTGALQAGSGNATETRRTTALKPVAFSLGNPAAFSVRVVDAYRVQGSPLQPFTATDLTVFLADNTAVPFYLQEVYDAEAPVDYLVRVRDGAALPPELSDEALLELALSGTTPEADLRGLHCRTSPQKGVERICFSSFPRRAYAVLKGAYRCLSGCLRTVRFRNRGLTVAVSYPGARLDLCEVEPSRFAPRSCLKVSLEGEGESTPQTKEARR